MHGVRLWGPFPTSQGDEWMRRWVDEDPWEGDVDTEKGGAQRGPSTSSISCYEFMEKTCIICAEILFDVIGVCGQLYNGPQRRLCQVPSTCACHLIWQKTEVFADVVQNVKMGTLSGIICGGGGVGLNVITGVLISGSQRGI